MLLIISFSTITCLIGTIFGLFLLYLSLKIKTEFREILRFEIDKNRKFYQFLREKGSATIVEIIRKMEGIPIDHPDFPAKGIKWEKFLKDRVKGEPKTLEFINGKYFLSDEVKRFFKYDDPSVRDLLEYIYLKYIKREKVTG